MMGNDSEVQAAMLERLSALMDGELEGDATAAACGHWRESVVVRSQWHAYHVIGDVMRSDDLATDPASDSAFLAAFRARIAGEPVVLAPQSGDVSRAAGRAAELRVANGARAGRWSWVGTSAMAAGFVAVAGVLVLTRSPGTPGVSTTPSQMAAVTQSTGATPMTVSIDSSSPPVASANDQQVFVANGQFIRDARLDRYLAAHKQFAGSSALGVPSAYLRNATADAADR